MYASIALVAAPAAFGSLLNTWLRRAERHGTLGRRHALAGARDARDSFDYIFGKLERQGCYVVVRRKHDERLIAGTFGTASWAGKAPEPHDLYIEEVRSLSEDGAIGPALEPKHGLWLPADSIGDVFVVEPPV